MVEFPVFVYIYVMYVRAPLVWLQVVTDGYYAKEGKSCLRADYNLYSGM